jgi:hypothetical protein
MKVRIVCYEDVYQWILGKFALKMQENLLKLGIEVDIDNVPDKKADINHHIIYYNYSGIRNSIDTLMITHIDDISKMKMLQKQLESAQMGICLSNETMIKLSNLGIPRDKLCFINPAHDGIITPRPKVIGITCRVQPDGRKREYFLNRLAKDISPMSFSFKIMGDGWDEQVSELKNHGFKVEYTDYFLYEEYIKLIPNIDYFLYMGQDEGQMGFIDALAAGIETIVTPQGYHLDAPNGITYPFNKYEELLSIFKILENKRMNLINSVSTWNWFNYSKKHLEIWDYLIKKDGKGLDNIELSPRTNNNDGINSISCFSQDKDIKISYIKRYKIRLKLLIEKFWHFYYLRKSSMNHKNHENSISQ